MRNVQKVLCAVHAIARIDPALVASEAEVQCRTARRTACCNAARHVATPHGMLQRRTERCNAAQHVATQRSTLQRRTAALIASEARGGYHASTSTTDGAYRLFMGWYGVV
jgi:hypothetical protein